MASGSYQIQVGEARETSAAQQTVSTIVDEMIDAMCEPEVLEKLIKFPRNAVEARIVIERLKFNFKNNFYWIVRVVFPI